MKLIVVVDEAWGIGRGNKLLFSLPEDMAFFRKTTTGKVVVMGHRTLKSFPGSAPLKNRANIVLSRNPDLQIPGASVCHSLEGLADVLAGFDPENVYVIGGASVYRQLLHHCTEALVTRVRANAGADSFFPDIDGNPDWALKEKSDDKIHEGLKFNFCVYANQDVKPFPPPNSCIASPF